MMVRLSNITFRQYMALVYIFTRISRMGRVPTKEEIKKVIETKSDRILDATLNALKRKGLINYYGINNDPIVSISEEAKGLISKIADETMLIDKYESYDNIKPQVRRTNIKNFFKPLQDYLLPISLEKLNNEKKIFHRWYTYLQDFEPSLVWNKILSYKIGRGQTILDPFVGSGTTVVTAKLMGIDSIGIDINPVAYFATKVKADIAWKCDLEEFKREANSILTDLENASPILKQVRVVSSINLMKRMELYQWLKPKDQNEISYLKERIMEVSDENIRNTLLLALASSAVESSNVAFCPGTTFYPFRKRKSFRETFIDKVNYFYEDLLIARKLNREYGSVTCYHEDSRNMIDFIDKKVDFIITSPPYPNDLEYTRQTRLELYLLDFVKSMKDVREIKKKMIKGSTKLIFKDSNSAQYVEKFESIQNIAKNLEKAFEDKYWGWDYPRMIREYFGDLYLSLNAFKEVLRKNGYALLVVGDQTYKNILIPVGKITAEIAESLGFRIVGIELLRNRYSTLHDIPLKEEIVIIKKP